MNVSEYMAQNGVDCSDIETSVLLDMTAKYLGGDYEGSWKF